MPHSLPFQRLRIYVLARELAVLVQRLELRDDELRYQATRAAKSCLLNIAEGMPSDQPLVRRRYLCIAKGSVCEVVAALDLAEACGFITASTAEPIVARAVEVKRLLSAMSR